MKQVHLEINVIEHFLQTFFWPIFDKVYLVKCSVHHWLHFTESSTVSLQSPSCEPLEIFLNGAEFSLNSANSGNLRNHWSMNWAQFKDPVSHMCLAGTVVAAWSLTQEVAGSSPFTIMKNIFVTEFSEKLSGALGIKFNNTSHSQDME